MVTTAQKVYFGLLSLAILGLCSTNIYREITPPWKTHQENYYNLLADREADYHQANRIRNTPLSFDQIYNPELKVVDRCTVCHIGIDGPEIPGAQEPYRKHPGNIIQIHNYQKIGCTVCHQGQGRATALPDAHGETKHWAQPLLRGDFIQASCTACHQEQDVPQATALSRGRRMLQDEGCTACHKIGNSDPKEFHGPNLATIGSKVKHRWLIKWIKDPRQYLPKSRMPSYRITDEESRELAAFLLRLRDKQVDTLKLPEGDYDAGLALYRQSRCISCHAQNGVGGIIGPDLGKIGNKAKPAWIFSWIKDAHRYQPNTKMPVYHFTDKEIIDLVAYMMEEFVDYDLLDAEEKEPKLPEPAPETAQAGQKLFHKLGCVGCHRLTLNSERERIGPELTYMGSKNAHELDFGQSNVPHTLPDFLFTKLKDPAAFDTEKNKAIMPDYKFNDEHAEALTIALLSMKEQQVPSRRYQVPAKPVSHYQPQGPWGKMVDRYRCFSCHSINGRGGTLAPDISIEGSKVNRAWLFDYLKYSYTIRPILVERMPIFRFSDEECQTMTDYIMSSLVSDEVPTGIEKQFTPKLAAQGKTLVEAKGCKACHIIGKKGGYVGPSFTTGSAYIGDRFQPGYLFAHVKNPKKMDPRTMEPNYGFSNRQALAVAAYLSSLKAPSKKESKP